MQVYNTEMTISAYIFTVKPYANGAYQYSV